MSDSYKNVIETIEECDLDTFLATRTKQLASSAHLGTHDIIVMEKQYIRKGLLSLVANNSPSKVYHHNVVGLEIDPAFLCSYVHSLLKTQDLAPITYRGEYKTTKIVCCTYDAISRCDLRVSINIPGSTSISSIHVDSFETSSPSEEQWNQASHCSFCRFSLPIPVPNSVVLSYDYKYENNIIAQIKKEFARLLRIGLWKNQDSLIDSNHPVFILLSTYFSTSFKLRAGIDFFSSLCLSFPCSSVYWCQLLQRVGRINEGILFVRKLVKEARDEGLELPYFYAYFANLLQEISIDLNTKINSNDGSDEVESLKSQRKSILEESFSIAHVAFSLHSCLFTALSLAQCLVSQELYGQAVVVLNNVGVISENDVLLFGFNDSISSQLENLSGNNESNYTQPSSVSPSIKILIDWAQELENLIDSPSDSINGFKRIVYDFFIKLIHHLGYVDFKNLIAGLFPALIPESNDDEVLEEEEEDLIIEENVDAEGVVSRDESQEEEAQVAELGEQEIVTETVVQEEKEEVKDEAKEEECTEERVESAQDETVEEVKSSKDDENNEQDTLITPDSPPQTPSLPTGSPSVLNELLEYYSIIPTSNSQPSQLLHLILYSVFHDISVYNEWRVEESKRKEEFERSVSRSQTPNSEGVGSFSVLSTRDLQSIIPDTSSFYLWLKRAIVSRRLLYFNESVYAFRTSTGISYSLLGWTSLGEIFSQTALAKECLICLNVVIKKYFRVDHDWTAAQIVDLVGKISPAIKKPFFRIISHFGLQHVRDEMLTISDLSPVFDYLCHECVRFKTFGFDF
ncbi:hypothetical protein RCL1_005687 [Eukaryota sp. TZLM3-RCL]